MKKYFTLIMILMAVILFQVNSCTMKPAQPEVSPELQQAEMTGRLMYSSFFHTY